HAHPLAEGGAVGAAVHGHVVHFAQGDADQLALGVVFLEMQTAQHALGGTALVVLHKGTIDARRGELIRLVGLHKIAAVVAENRRFNDDDAGDLGLDKIELAHLCCSSVFIKSGTAGHTSTYTVIFYSVLPVCASTTGVCKQVVTIVSGPFPRGYPLFTVRQKTKIFSASSLFTVTARGFFRPYGQRTDNRPCRRIVQTSAACY